MRRWILLKMTLSVLLAVLLAGAPALAAGSAKTGEQPPENKITLVEKATGRTIELREGGATKETFVTVMFSDPTVGDMTVQVLEDGTLTTDTGYRLWTSISEDILERKRVRPQSVTVVRSGPGFDETFTVDLDPKGSPCPQDAAQDSLSADPLIASFSETAQLASFNPEAFDVIGAGESGNGGLGKTSHWTFPRFMACVGCGLGTIALVGTFVGLVSCVTCGFLLVMLPVMGVSWAYECGNCVGG